MPETLQALVIVLVAVLPGAVATLSYERHVGTFAAEFQERMVRFIVASVLVSPVSAVLGMLVWTRVLHLEHGGRHRNALVEGGLPSPAWLLVPIAYVAAPMCIGWCAGWMQDRRIRSMSPKRMERVLGRLEAWDALFLDRSPKILIARLRSGGWFSGVFAARSIVAPRTAKNRDVYLEVALDVTDKGLLVLDEAGDPIPIGGGMLLRTDDIEVLRVVHLAEA